MQVLSALVWRCAAAGPTLQRGYRAYVRQTVRFADNITYHFDNLDQQPYIEPGATHLHYYRTAQRSIVMSVSVCLSVCVCLSVIISPQLHTRPIFANFLFM